MKKIALILAAIASPASAEQQRVPALEDVQAQYLVETGQLRQALGQAHAQIIQLRKENADLKAKGEQKPEVKK
jgi:hypothetical protein